MKPRKRAPSAGPDVIPTPEVRRDRHTPAAAAPSSPAAVLDLQRRAGNRATGRLVLAAGHERSTTPQASAAALQRAFTVIDLDGTEQAELDDIVVESRSAVREHLAAIEAADPDDFNGVWGNYLENPGIFDAYLRQCYADGDHDALDLRQAADVVRLYTYLKALVMADRAGAEAELAPEVAAPEPDAEPDEAQDEAPDDPGFTPAGIQFASISGGNVGSIYFTEGRIRLVHDEGPDVEHSPGVVRYAVAIEELDAWYDAQPDDEPVIGEDDVTQMPSCTPAVPGAAGVLVEFWPGYSHESRGGPSAFNYVLTQAQVNILYRAAMTHDNGMLRAAMDADPGLSLIPTN